MAPQRISNVDHCVKSLQTLRMKPFAEVRKNTRILLGPKKAGKEGTLSVLPIEILMMILVKTNDVFNEIDGGKRRKLILEYSKRPNMPSKFSMALTSVNGFLNNHAPNLDSWRQTSINVGTNILLNLAIVGEFFVRLYRERQAPQVQEPPRALTRFAQIQNIMASIAIAISTP